MGQRTEKVNEEMIVNLSFKVTLNSFSNHEGFNTNQIKNAVEEFKEKIKKQLEYTLNGEYEQQSFIESVDFVSYEVDSLNGL